MEKCQGALAERFDKGCWSLKNRRFLVYELMGYRTCLSGIRKCGPGGDYFMAGILGSLFGGVNVMK